MKLGDFAEVTRVFDSGMLASFDAMAGGGGQGSHVPEPLVAALFSYLLGVKLPGPGTNYLKQSLEFKSHAPANNALTARVEITRLRPEKHLVDLATTCHSADGTLICEGRALVLARDVGA